ncbi:hypothetical protein LSM04_007146 [Trypanosoma melophagium]|uniref:uncharacterized protein n=1 Tax=Trypanosoma melophagium TaxID=715481 RepID=UPI00351A7473|nr:hypothetical protein LSM04_007146 [Trypanosoma melophagium]
MSFRDGNDFISNEDEEVTERQASSGTCYLEESELVENTKEMEEEEEEGDERNEDYYEEEDEEEEMDDNDNDYDDGTEVKNEDMKGVSHSIVEGATSPTIAAAVTTTSGGGSVFQQTQNSPTATTLLFTPALSPSQGSHLLQMMKDIKTYDSSFPSLTATTAPAAACSVSESAITAAEGTKTGPQRHSFRFLDFSIKATTGAEKRPRFSSLSEEIATAKSFLSRFELSLPTTRFDEQLEDILSSL